MEGQFLPSLRQLRTFAAVARFEGISSAQLRLSQSAATQAIATLEAKLEVPLFVRRSTGSYLTEYGKILEKRTTRFFETIEGAIRELGTETDPVHRMSAAGTSHRITNSQVRARCLVPADGRPQVPIVSGSPFGRCWQVSMRQPFVRRISRSFRCRCRRSRCGGCDRHKQAKSPASRTASTSWFGSPVAGRHMTRRSPGRSSCWRSICSSS
jgi:hypothetical protein